MQSFWKGKKIVVTGGHGFVGSWVVDNLINKRSVEKGQIKIASSKEFDLRDFKKAVAAVENADIILHLAAKVGGVGFSSSHPATQMRDCMLIDLNIFEAAAQKKIQKLVSVSSAVAYPTNAKSPLAEEDFFLGPPANSSFGYSFAKRNTVVLAQAYRQERGLNTVVLLPNNSYGPGQEINLETGHVIPSLIYKCLTEKVLSVWGDGSAVRDFLYVEDFAEGIVLAAEKLNSPDPINLGPGYGISIKRLVEHIVKLTGFNGRVVYDTSKPKGQAKRVVNISKAKKLLGFSSKWNIHDGLEKTVAWVKKEIT